MLGSLWYSLKRHAPAIYYTQLSVNVNTTHPLRQINDIICTGLLINAKCWQTNCENKPPGSAYTVTAEQKLHVSHCLTYLI